MATQKGNLTMKGVTGQVGNVIFRKGRSGEQILSSRIMKKRKKNSPKQEEATEHFTDASAYARSVWKNPELKQLYAKKITPNKHTAYHVALSDYMNAPKIVYIKTEKYSGKIGDVFMIKAVDDFKVTSVSVTITDANGVVIEEGQAVPYIRRPLLWLYYAAVENSKLKGCVVKVVAADLPENKTEKEIVLEDHQQNPNPSHTTTIAFESSAPNQSILA